MKLSKCSEFLSHNKPSSRDSHLWLSRITSELCDIPPMAYWICGIAATAVVSAVVASSFQQSLSELRINSTLSREIALRENYESEIQDLKFQLGELRGQLDQDNTSLNSQSVKQQEQLVSQLQELEALVMLAEKSNLILSTPPPSPQRKPDMRRKLSLNTAILAYAPQHSQNTTPDLLSTLSATNTGVRTNQPPGKHLPLNRQQGKLLLTAYMQAALDDIKRASTLLKKAGIAHRELEPVKPSMGGIYQQIETVDMASSLSAARQLILQRIELNSKVDALPFARPLVSFSISSSFGARTDPFLGKPAMHTGLDFRAPKGTPVMATGTGIVSFAHYNGGYGLSVEIVHDNGLVTRYAHMQKLLVSEGQRIHMGDIVGTVGNTGRSTGPHLHYEVRLNGKPINPMRFIRTGDRLAAIFRPKQHTKVALNLP